MHAKLLFVLRKDGLLAGPFVRLLLDVLQEFARWRCVVLFLCGSGHCRCQITLRSCLFLSPSVVLSLVAGWLVA